jgi:hypothetical protein
LASESLELHGSESPEVERIRVRRRDPVSIFKNRVVVPVGLCGPISRALIGRGQNRRTFSGLGCLGWLFCRGRRRTDSRTCD